MALKMFITDQLYLLKKQVGNPKAPQYNCSSKSDKYIKSLIEQIHYLKEENKMKNSFISLCYSGIPLPLFLMIFFSIMIKLIRPLQLLMMTIFLMIMMVQRMRITTLIKRIQQLGRIRIRKRKGKTKILKIRTKK